jgi:hypothetical protein
VSATRFNDALNALLALYQAAPAFAGIPVYDGVQPTVAADNDFLVAGHDGSLGADGTLAADAPAGFFSQSDIDMGGRQETGYVNCLVVAQTGDAGDTAGRRQRASDLLSAAEGAAAAHGGLLTGDAAGIMIAGTSDGRFINRLGAGTAVMIAYRVAYSTEWD